MAPPLGMEPFLIPGEQAWRADRPLHGEQNMAVAGGCAGAGSGHGVPW